MGEAGAQAFSPVVVAPTYNNAGTLAGILERIDRQGLPTIVVDDGSTDGTREILARWSAAGPGRTVLAHARNQGKAAALRTAFAGAEHAGHTHAVTVDTDGQHDPEDVARLVDLAREHPQTLIIGARSLAIPGYPMKSSTGRRLSNLFVRFESGARVGDSQSGFRVYPLGLVRTVRTRAGRFAFETEILTRAAWAKCEIVETPISSRYLPLAERVSHFRPWVDTLRAVGMHLRLLGRAIMPIPHRAWPGPRERDPRPLWKRAWAWVNPLKFWIELRRDPESRPTAAAGFALGAFLANTPPPLYGLHLPLGLYLARRLNLHPLPVTAGCLLAAWPMGLLLLAADVGVGNVVLDGHWPNRDDLHWQEGHFWEWAWGIFPEWWTGGMLVGMLTAAIGFLMVKALLSRMPVRTNGPETQFGGSGPAHAASDAGARGASRVPVSGDGV